MSFSSNLGEWVTDDIGMLHITLVTFKTSFAIYVKKVVNSVFCGEFITWTALCLTSKFRYPEYQIDVGYYSCE